MIAMIDEAVAEHSSGNVYVVVAVVVVKDQSMIQEQLTGRIYRDNRIRPSHWHEEGPFVRGIISEVSENVGAIGQAFLESCGRSGQEAARVRMLNKALDWISREGAGEVMIESRGPKLDIRDRRTVKRFQLENDSHLAVKWAQKKEPLLWLADALAGATRENLLRPGASLDNGRLLAIMGAEFPNWVEKG